MKLCFFRHDGRVLVFRLEKHTENAKKTRRVSFSETLEGLL
jgi:hypothetical protein